ncbi:glycosyltransferase [Shewanella eurypsychrophilus]|uniref:Glycosyltransferase n=1 Tax=Shewanella eurypsychrophilus TaxID=2593656 RepID=A0ABX6V1E8_9GAMM|nr:MULTISPECIES: MJ1255/VC2487 family glycosyltransferase [Shewanella]QFU21162.1 glycosyltransferase [Shewanella sp. YLB-09]QPG56453.1 glycosyltransferase [Shewanella eurypsychrophilus]
MRILYGVQGTGNGHLSRARVMAKSLRKYGVNVDFFFSGRSAADFFDMQCFGQYQVEGGLTFATRNGRVSMARTAWENSVPSLLKDIHSLDLSPYDLVLNDFEPVSAWAAKRQGITSIGVSHQAALKYDVPKVGSNWFNETLLSYFAPVDIALGCHWHHFGFPILPPFVEVNPVESINPHQILVYLPFEDPDKITQLLSPFKDYCFHVYHGAQPKIPYPNHIKWSGFSREGFKQKLSTCGGVIGSAGFELASEALALGKKLLVKPLHGQFEQLSNVAALELLGAAETMAFLDCESLRRWLKSAAPQAIHYPQVGDALVKWLLAGDWHSGDKLCRQLWNEVDLPQSWRKKNP